VDVVLLLRRFREAIKHIDRWEVRETAHVGLFTFSKFLMWLDLQEREADLRASRVVTHLVDRPGAAFDTAPFPRAEALDVDLPVDQSMGPLDADSSQLVAAAAACAGRTFVLEGPPGTGKSQTITNIIAQSIAAGKRVLFVAEKMAALSVVQRRLERIGLAPFCLEVHSSKASKKEVLAQIEQAFEAAGAREPAQWHDHARHLGESRAGLNRFVQALHRVRPIGRSFYQMASELVGLSEAPDVEVAISDAAAIDGAAVAALRRQVEALRVAANAVGDIPTHPLREIGRGEWKDSLPDQACSAITATEAALGSLVPALQGFMRQLAPTADPSVLETWSRADVQWLNEVTMRVGQCPGVTAAMLTGPGWIVTRAHLHDVIRRGRERDALRTTFRSSASDAILTLEPGRLAATIRVGAAKIWPLNWLTCRMPRATLRSVWKGDLPDNACVVDVLDAAQACRDEAAFLVSESSQGTRFFGQAFKDGEADWDSLAASLFSADLVRRLLNLMPRDVTGQAIGDAIVGYFTGAEEFAARSAAIESAATAVVAKSAEFARATSALESLLKVAQANLPDACASGFVPGTRALLARWRAGLADLDEWCFWRRACQGLAPELIPLAEAIESARLHSEQLVPAFEKAVARSWVSAVGDATPELRDFNASARDGAIETFRALDNRWLELAAQIAKAYLAQRVPARLNVESTNATGTEMGILAHQMRLQRRHMPVRRLIGKLPNVLPRLKPCFLMSPLSVAQYLDPAYPPFDLVIFDEASQIPVWDAVGAIARGTSVVVVGDSKQLPPTNFFHKLDGEEGALDEDDFEELESVLDECAASGLPSMRLLWHYRSRHESLIAFSNHHYYQGRLFTFPVPQERSADLGVSLRFIENGVYDRGGSRTNRAEAEAIVAELVSRLSIPSAGESDNGVGRRPSIGVVTFSQAQQTLVEDLLDAKRREDPTFDAALSEGEEPVFVKNLENVQGDERDVILFSICYAPDSAGRMAMVFGPLNRDGGERRLNVAVTRARRQVIVFSSIRADQIDLARTGALGAAHLKSFLEYAQRGPSAIGEASADAPPPLPGALEVSIRRELEARGWEVDAQVGCSGYRLDLAVRDPAHPGRYLLGIESDGEFYSGAHTARDRDRLRAQVLAGLGWRLHRVWSSDWRRNRARAMQKIEHALSGEPAPSAHAPATPAPRLMSGPPAPVDAPPAEAMTMPSPHGVPYAPFASRSSGNAADFYERRSTTRIAEIIRAVIEHEGPIVRALVVRRLAAHWGIERVTTRVEARIAEVLAIVANQVALQAADDTLWPIGVSPDSFTSFRTHGDEAFARRDAEHIPTREIANAAAAVLRAHIAMSEDDLVRHTALALGFSRPTERIATEMRRGITDLMRRDGCKLSARRITLP